MFFRSCGYLLWDYCIVYDESLIVRVRGLSEILQHSVKALSHSLEIMLI